MDALASRVTLSLLPGLIMTSNPAIVLVVVCAAIGGVEALRWATRCLMTTVLPAAVVAILPLVFRLGLAAFMASRTVRTMLEVQHHLSQSVETIRIVGSGFE